MKIRAARKRALLSLKELAERADCCYVTAWSACAGRPIAVKTARALARVLRVALKDLLPVTSGRSSESQTMTESSPAESFVIAVDGLGVAEGFLETEGDE